MGGWPHSTEAGFSEAREWQTDPRLGSHPAKVNSSGKYLYLPVIKGRRYITSSFLGKVYFAPVGLEKQHGLPEGAMELDAGRWEFQFCLCS